MRKEDLSLFIVIFVEKHNECCLCILRKKIILIVKRIDRLARIVFGENACAIHIGQARNPAIIAVVCSDSLRNGYFVQLKHECGIG